MPVRRQTRSNTGMFQFKTLRRWPPMSCVCSNTIMFQFKARRLFFKA
ncbi:hypothetical protein HMPREF1981_01433, partial [Bacteroides pyogenes F0041]